MGFFQESQLLASKAPISRIPQCGKCGLLKQCKSPKMPVSGRGERKILIVGEAPGKEEDSRNKPFVGPTGQLLEQTLNKFGINMRLDCWITNSLICRPPDNREPTPTEIDCCRPNLINTIEKLNPEIIVPLGGPAVKSVIGWLWKDQVGGIGRWQGWQIPLQKLNCWICPTWHPSFVARNDPRDASGRVVSVLWHNDLQRLSKLRGRPWDVVPDYKKKVEIIIDPSDAADAIRDITKAGGTCAFDYETNCLKPDWDDAEIISCSICQDGARTVSFPWVGSVPTAMREFLRSPIRKIASNLKFEDRWTRRKLKTKVRNWWHDTMIAGHIQDNRREITSIKFQSFVWLGAESYNDHITPFLRTKGDKKINQIVKNIELKQLLLYGGLDSVLEFHTCMKQREVLGYGNSD